MPPNKFTCHKLCHSSLQHPGKSLPSLVYHAAQLPSCQAANQLSEVTNCKLRQHCYDSFCNQQLSSDGKSAQWASNEKEGETGKGRITAAREEEERRISAAVHQCLRAQTLLRILLSQQPRIVGLKQKAMQSECTHLMFALAFPVTSCQLPVTSYCCCRCALRRATRGVANSVARQ